MSRILMGRALRGAKASVWEQQACMAQQQRSFSQTPSRQTLDPQVVFDKTTTPGLAPILEEIQSNIILPYYLPIHQRKRVFSEKLKHRLKNDPVYLEIDGLEHRFSHINEEALPPSREVTWKALRAMQTPQDWNNFARLLSGMRNAGRHYSQTDFAKMIRIAGARGQIYTIIDAARQVRKTGLRLDNSEKANEVLHFVQMRAVESEWDKEKTEQALRWSEMVLEMLEDVNHAPDGRKVAKRGKGRFPLFKDPQILGAALHLSAVLAVKHNDGKDLDGKVAGYAKKVADGWPAGKGLLQLHPQEAYADRVDGVAYLAHSRTQYLSYASPILHGLFMAARVVDKPLADRLHAIAAALGNEVKEVVEKQDYPAERGLKTYNALFNSS
ncbi:hypothetical protein ColTof4_13411 [Colletotrichum tofieldiae]|uniref:Uncharacterized protein n=1 Tax=Colletotrichum liriopes TaxID=708192 RepID=A0AA37H1R4_9PEZI|nr:hypothetical protein ColLi_13742 [Colletotrichum liriopes]GKT53175.1 hypothetical protein ColTof3_00514 [Colletotrichum tofieldiae]GKT80988.1 hypothetical protein ColTof4_13411 [Colletotrichum tofieldiae]GKT88422.1 hypothetical protein Ct61P_06272 [Colletotrichum tofieldiae]